VKPVGTYGSPAITALLPVVGDGLGEVVVDADGAVLVAEPAFVGDPGAVGPWPLVQPVSDPATASTASHRTPRVRRRGGTGLTGAPVLSAAHRPGAPVLAPIVTCPVLPRSPGRAVGPWPQVP
jgi:hypothetical protein